MRKVPTFSMAVLFLAVSYNLAAGQVMTPSILVIKVENQVGYSEDLTDSSKFGTNPDVTPPAGFPRNFGEVILLGDIVSVNGQPAKGVFVGRNRVILLRRSPSPGEAIADLNRLSIRDVIFEILKSDDTPIGSIVGLGFSAGSPPPGAPLVHGGGSWAIVGGTGAFLGGVANLVEHRLQTRETRFVRQGAADLGFHWGGCLVQALAVDGGWQTKLPQYAGPVSRPLPPDESRRYSSHHHRRIQVLRKSHWAGVWASLCLWPGDGVLGRP
jgi:hypothetical protein